MNIEQTQQAEEFFDMIKDIKNYKEIFETVLPQITPYIDRLVDYSVDKKIQAVRRFQDKGFSREEALNLTLDIEQRIFKQLKNINKHL